MAPYPMSGLGNLSLLLRRTDRARLGTHPTKAQFTRDPGTGCPPQMLGVQHPRRGEEPPDKQIGMTRNHCTLDATPERLKLGCTERLSKQE